MNSRLSSYYVCILAIQQSGLPALWNAIILSILLLDELIGFLPTFRYKEPRMFFPFYVGGSICPGTALRYSYEEMVTLCKMIFINGFI